LAVHEQLQSVSQLAWSHVSPAVHGPKPYSLVLQSLHHMWSAKQTQNRVRLPARGYAHESEPSQAMPSGADGGQRVIDDAPLPLHAASDTRRTRLRTPGYPAAMVPAWAMSFHRDARRASMPAPADRDIDAVSPPSRAGARFQSGLDSEGLR
jgi:hypothetical protein